MIIKQNNFIVERCLCRSNEEKEKWEDNIKMDLKGNRV
jgi:hypothetical protein